MQESVDLPPVGIVGAGAVGSALARRLVDRGERVEVVVSRTQADARALAEKVGASVAGTVGTALPTQVQLVLICVPDEAIAAVAEALAALDHPWTETLVAHTSGALTSEVLAPLARQGAATLSIHPLQTFAPDTPPEAFENIFVGLEGDASAVEKGEGLVRALGARPLRLTAETKAQYHAAAALASNGLVALMGVVQEVLAGADVEGASAAEVVAPLVEQTWENLTQKPPEDVLTGPVARGDRETVEAHLDALADTTPHLMPLYAALSTEMTRMAVRNGQLDRGHAEAMLDVLQAALEASTDGTDPHTPLH